MNEGTVLLKDIDSLPPKYYCEVIDFVGYLKEKIKKEANVLETSVKITEDFYNPKGCNCFSVFDGKYVQDIIC